MQSSDEVDVDVNDEGVDHANRGYERSEEERENNKQYTGFRRGFTSMASKPLPNKKLRRVLRNKILYRRNGTEGFGCIGWME